MASATTANGEKKTAGREAKYKLNLDNADLKNVTLSTTKDGKEYKVEAQELSVKDLGKLLDVFSNDEEKMYEFISEALTTYIQRGPRQKLNTLKQGPEKAIERMVASLTKGGIPEDVAKEFVIARLKVQGVL